MAIVTDISSKDLKRNIQFNKLATAQKMMSITSLPFHISFLKCPVIIQAVHKNTAAQMQRTKTNSNAGSPESSEKKPTEPKIVMARDS
ncbi:hypothetical protein PSKAS_37100 [Peribacillus sp. N1]